MIERTKCTCCNGSGSIMSIGMMKSKCPECDGKGWTTRVIAEIPPEIEKPSEEEITSESKAKRGRPVKPKE